MATLKDTYFAPAQRTEREKILNQNKIIEADPFLNTFFDLLPLFLLVLDENRQLLFCNHALIEYLSIQDLNEILGLRPGEIFYCQHSDEMPYGCGTSSSCNYCGAAQALVEAKKSQKPVSRECRIVCKKGAPYLYFTLKIHVIPYSYRNKVYYLFYLQDISAEKRMLQLERIFLHDIGNLLTILNANIELLPKKNLDADQLNRLHEIAQISNYIRDEILFQRDFNHTNSIGKKSLSTYSGNETGAAQQTATQQTAAQPPSKNPLNIRKITGQYNSSVRSPSNLANPYYQTAAEDFKIFELLEDCVNLIISRYPDFPGSIEIECNSTLSVKQDRTIIRRIVLNLLKNSLEAEMDSINQNITKIGSKTLIRVIGAVFKEELHISIWNSTVMPVWVKSQLFQFGFSTKGNDRGYGLYGVKFLVEQVLQGLISVKSEVSTGTEVEIIIPLGLQINSKKDNS